MGGTLAFLVVGERDMFGFPEPMWGRVVFSPGTFAAMMTYELLDASKMTCEAVAVVTMGALGGLLGLAAGLFDGRR